MSKITWCFAALAALSGSAEAAPLINGSFELGTDPGSFTTVGPGGSAITGWTVGGIDGVDYIGSYWQAQDGVRSVDLSGNGPGSVSQLIDTDFGQQYTVSFWLAGNPDGGDTAKLTVTSVAGTVPQFDTFTVVPGTNTHANMGWQQYAYTFTAFGAQSLLTFASGEDNAYGPALDNVAITAVPEPASWAMMLAGFGVIGYSLRTRKTSMRLQAV